MCSSTQPLQLEQQQLIQDHMQNFFQVILQKTIQANHHSKETCFNPEHYHFLLYFLQLKQDQNIATDTLFITEASEKLHLLFMSLTNSSCHDHIEGGFINSNLIKSLTINGVFLDLFSDFSGYFLDGYFSVPAIHSAQWLLNNLQAKDGAFYQCMGTDNEEQLTDYYSISSEELDNLLDKDSRTAFFSAYGITSEEGAFVPSKLTQIRSYQQIAEHTNLHIKQVPLALENALQLLSIARNNKTPPSTEQTFSLAGNCRAINALFKAARQFNRDDFSSSALTALESLNQQFPSEKIKFCSDYLLLLNTLITRLQYQWCENTYQRLKSVASQFLTSSANDAQKIIQAMDDEGLNNCIDIFYNLEILTNNKDFHLTAVSVSTMLEKMILSNSITNPVLLTAYLRCLFKSHLIIITGKAFEASYWSQQLSSGFNPSTNCFVISDNVKGPQHLTTSSDNKTTATIFQLGVANNKHLAAKQSEDSLDKLLENYSSTKKRYP